MKVQADLNKKRNQKNNLKKFWVAEKLKIWKKKRLPNKPSLI